MLCKQRGILCFAEGLCRAQHRTNEGKDPGISFTLTGPLLISIKIPLEISKAGARATPRSGGARIAEKRLFSVGYYRKEAG